MRRRTRVTTISGCVVLALVSIASIVGARTATQDDMSDPAGLIDRTSRSFALVDSFSKVTFTVYLFANDQLPSVLLRDVRGSDDGSTEISFPKYGRGADDSRAFYRSFTDEAGGPAATVYIAIGPVLFTVIVSGTNDVLELAPTMADLVPTDPSPTLDAPGNPLLDQLLPQLDNLPIGWALAAEDGTPAA